MPEDKRNPDETPDTPTGSEAAAPKARKPRTTVAKRSPASTKPKPEPGSTPKPARSRAKGPTPPHGDPLAEPTSVAPAVKRAPRARKAGVPKSEPSSSGATRAARPKLEAPTPIPIPIPALTPEPSPLSILMVTSEAHPFAKTGGLAEVTSSLTDALAALGHTVTLVVPRYRSIALDGLDKPLETRLRLGDRLQPVAFYERRLSERAVAVFVDMPALFDRDGLYGSLAGDYPDNAYRFAAFSRAALEYPRLRGERPSVIHAHDWQTGLVPVYQKMQLSDDPYAGGVPVLFTIHNLAFQGVFPAGTLPSIGLSYEVMDVQGLEFWGNISYLKGGINFSEKISTVSPSYAREIVGPELGFGFEGVLARRSGDLVGILNGIDIGRWTPTADPFVSATFSADDLSGKQDAKKALLDLVKLPTDATTLRRPVIGLVSRLTDQKGFDLILGGVDELMALDVSWVMLGSGERRYEDAWRALASKYPDRVSTTIGFDERLAHHIEAGADMFLMPSRFEPCGLNQMYSLRYGTVPVVRATGGLKDTVDDADAAASSGTGFTFTDYSPGALVATVRRALAAFADPARWAAIAARGMRRDHSWDGSAREYVKVYRESLKSEV